MTTQIYPPLPLERSTLLPEPELPDAQEIISEGVQLGRQISPTRCAFLTHYDVDSEAQYKRRRVAEGKTMFHAQIGFRDVDKTRRACAQVYEALDRLGYRVDRFGMTFDRNMGYLPDARKDMPKGTGLILESIDDWHAVTSSAPVASHYGDFMIGMPAAVENTTAALEVGATTIGNLSHFYTYRLLYQNDEVDRAVATLKSMAIMAGQPNEVSVSSNMDDGFGSLFVDIACTLGLVMVEQHLVETLIGTPHVTVFGNTVSNPFNRVVFQRALSKITNNMGPMVYGATTLYTPNETANQAALSHYLSFDIAAQALSPSGHAVTAVPITEYERIPDTEEIIEVQTVANRLAELAGETLGLIDQEVIDETADKLIEGARTFKKNMFHDLTEAGVDTDNALELLLVIRRMGARELESRFGPGVADKTQINGRQAILLSENMQQLHETGRNTVDSLSETRRQHLREAPLTACIATTDVHEYGKIVLEQVFKDLQFETADAGVSADPQVVAKKALDNDADFIALSTYNGIALTYLRTLREEIEFLGLDIPVFVGGRINQIPESSNTSLPVDVSDKVRDLRMTVCNDVVEMLDQLVQIKPRRHDHHPPEQIN